jgi:hypothetical protein
MADKNAVWEGLPEGFAPKNQAGFVYLIENLEEGASPKYYIGKKNFWSRSKGQWGESKWREYQSSSDTVKKWKTVRKRVLCLCDCAFELSYREIETIIKSEAVLRTDFANFAIGREMIGRCPNYMLKTGK